MGLLTQGIVISMFIYNRYYLIMLHSIIVLHIIIKYNHRITVYIVLYNVILLSAISCYIIVIGINYLCL